MPQYYYNPFGHSADANEEMKKRLAEDRIRQEQKRELRHISISMGLTVICYIILNTVVAFVMMMTDTYTLYYSNAVFQNCVNIIGISVFSLAVPFGLMALINRRRYTDSVIPNSTISLKKAFLWIFFGMGCCIAANIAVSFLITFIKEVFGYQLVQSEQLEPNSVISCITLFLSTAVVPAICEEFAMRCCSLQLLKKYGKGFSVFAVSVVFGLLHGNIIQFLFAFLVGLILAFVTIKTDSIYPAIFIHFLNNSMSVMQSIIQYAVNEKTAENVLVILYIIYISAGIISLLCLLYKKEFFVKREKSNILLSSWEKFVSFYCTGMIIPFIILIVVTARTVEKI